LEHTSRRDANIVVILERGANQILQFAILKNVPPFLVAERSRNLLAATLVVLNSLRLCAGCVRRGESDVAPRYVTGTSTLGRL
jgi:hypothetical protein